MIEDKILAIFPYKAAANSKFDIEELVAWCSQYGKDGCPDLTSGIINQQGNWTWLPGTRFYFKEDRHAVEFKLRFG